MIPKEEVIKAVRAALERETRIGLHTLPVKVDYAEDGALILEGEVKSLSAKKLALKLSIQVPGVVGIVDRLRVKPAERMQDGMILDLIRDALTEEPALKECAIRLQSKGKTETVREATGERSGQIEVSVRDGVVYLNNSVVNLTQKRIAEVLSWWAPGTRDVINELEVNPPEEDNDDEITDALRIILEKDPLLNSDSISVETRNSVVFLRGHTESEAQKEIAENDAWTLFGVDAVVNHLSVKSP